MIGTRGWSNLTSLKTDKSEMSETMDKVSEWSESQLKTSALDAFDITSASLFSLMELDLDRLFVVVGFDARNEQNAAAVRFPAPFSTTMS